MLTLGLALWNSQTQRDHLQDKDRPLDEFTRRRLQRQN
jgi:hypothetical protein